MDWEDKIRNERQKVRAFLAYADYADDYSELDRSPAPTVTDVWILARTDRPKVIDGRPMYYCPFCNRKDQFWDGRFVLCSDGRVRLIGHDCADKNIGYEAWREAQERFDRELIAEKFAELQEKIIPAANSAIDEIDRWRSKTSHLARTKKHLSALKTQFPSLYEVLKQGASSGGSLTVESRIESLAKIHADTSEDERFTKYENVRRHVHTLRGGGAFVEKEEVDTLIDRAVRSLKAVAEEGPNIPRNTYAQFIERFEQVRDIAREGVGRVERAVNVLRSWQKFLSPTNVKPLCDWLNDSSIRIYGLSRAESIKNGIRFRDYLEDLQLRLPPNFAIPRFENVERLRQLLW